MALSPDILSQFAKLVNKKDDTNNESVVYGTVVKDGSGMTCVQLDGSNVLTPITYFSSTVDIDNIIENERVSVLIKNHTATITGNTSSPSVRGDTVDEQISNFGSLIVYTVTAEDAEFIKSKTDEMVSIIPGSSDDATVIKGFIENIAGRFTEGASLSYNDAKTTLSDLDAVVAAFKNVSGITDEFLKTFSDNANAVKDRIKNFVYKSGDRIYIDEAIAFRDIEVLGRFAAVEAEILNLVAGDATITGKLTAAEAEIENLKADNITVSGKLTAAEGEIENLRAQDIEVTGKLTAAEGEIENLRTKNLEVDGKLTATEAEIENLKVQDLEVTGKLTAAEAEIGKLTVESMNISGKLTATEAEIEHLKANTVDTETLNAKFANIDFANIGEAAIKKFFAESGIIKDYVSENGVVTGKLVAVSINADNITTGSLLAERIMLQGDDGLFYKLNVDAMGKTTAEKLSSDEQAALKNGIHGKSIIAESITADKISVSDLVAFGATIGGFHISNGALYSGVKQTIGNTTAGIYLDSAGQLAVGDDDSFIKYYVDGDGSNKLEIAASSIKLGTKSVENAVESIAAAEATIELLEQSIQMLVTDENGQSLMTQTSNGWTFSTKAIQDQANDASDALAELVNRLGSSDAVIERLSDSVNEFGEIAQYVHIGEYVYTDENGEEVVEPSIDLFATDTGFKLKITNTRFIFSDGAIKLVEIDSKTRSLTTSKITVENELAIGNSYVKNYITSGEFESDSWYTLNLPIGTYRIFSEEGADTVQLYIANSKGTYTLQATVTTIPTTFEIAEGDEWKIYLSGGRDDIDLVHIEVGAVPPGAWLWKKRTNGNLGLMWIGGIS